MTPEIEAIILRHYPNARVNNSRAIVRLAVSRLIKKFEMYPSEILARRLEDLLPGLAVDFSENDWGNGPRGGN